MARRAPKQRYADIERLVDRMTPGYERMVLQTIALGPGRTNNARAEVHRLLKDGDTVGAVARAVRELVERADVMAPRLIDHRAKVSSAASRLAEMGSVFPPSYPPSVEYAREGVEKAIAAWTKQAWISGGEIMRRSVEEGWHADEAARRLRAGLGVTPGVFQKLSARYQHGPPLERAMRRAVRFRARVIARTTTMDAATYGQDEAWNKAVEEGYLNPNKVVRVWQVGYDERLCPICRPLGGKTAGIGKPFPIQGGLIRPPAHPQCRCSLSMRRKRRRSNG